MDEHFNPVLYTSPRRTLRERLEASVPIPAPKEELNKGKQNSKILISKINMSAFVLYLLASITMRAE